MKSLTIKSHRGDYKVFFEKGLKFLKELKKRKTFWIIDSKVHDLFGVYFNDLNPECCVVFEAKESKKTLEGATDLYRDLINKNCKRNTNLIVVSGGVIQDVAGFVASTFYRGLNWVFIPTTLLAQADSCIGSKTSLNFNTYKNLIGTFYPPKEIFISTEFCQTLSALDIASGIGEMLKLRLMRPRAFSSHDQIRKLAGVFDKVRLPKRPGLLQLVQESLAIKKKYIENDEFDLGKRRLLNYGHCFGHALESVSNFAIPHGLAVVAGMIFAYLVSRKRKWIEGGRCDLVIKNLLVPCFCRELVDLQDNFFNLHDLFEAMGKDKKRTSSGIPIILPQMFQLNQSQDLSYGELEHGVNELKKLLS